MKLWVGETDLIGHAIFNGKNTLVDIQNAVCCICAGDPQKVITRATEIRKSYQDKIIILVISGRVPVNILRLAKQQNFTICSPGKILEVLPNESEEAQENSLEIVNPVNLPVPTQNKGKVITSFSTSGEVGKTLNATNLAILSARDKKKTILLEFDLGKGNAMDALYIKPEGEYPNVLTWKEYGDNWYTKVLKSNTGLYLLPRSPDTLEINMSKQAAIKLIEEAKKHFDMVVIDMDRNPFEDHAKAALMLADQVFLITKIDDKGFNHAKAFLTTAARVLNLNKKICLIANMVNQYVKYSPAKAAELLGIESYGKIPYDIKVESAKKKGKPLVVYGKGQACHAIKEIYQKVLAGNISTKPKQSTIQKVLSSLLPKFFRKVV